MNKKVIIEKENLIAYDYLVDNLAGSGIKFKIKQSELFNTLFVELDEDMCDSFFTLIAKAIIISHKYKTIMSAFEDLELNFANITCISALLYFDFDSEIEQAVSVIKYEDSISIEGTFDFKLQFMRDDWEELKSIGEVLTFSQSEEDIYNVAGFMMTNRNSSKSLFLAGYPDILLANVTDGLMVEHIKLYKNEDFNLINSIIAESPAELILEKNQIKQSLLDCLSHIVKVKIL